MKLRTILSSFAILTFTSALNTEGGVTKLNTVSFNRRVNNTDSIWLVLFYSQWSSESRNFTGVFERAALALRGTVNLGVVDGDDDMGLSKKSKVYIFPTLKIYGVDKYPLKYTGPKTINAIVDFAKEAIKQKIDKQLKEVMALPKKKPLLPAIEFNNTVVTVMGDGNHEKIIKDSVDCWFVMYYVQDCEMSRALAPVWIKAAEELKGKINFGAVDISKNLKIKEIHNITDFPTIRHYAKGKGYSGPNRFKLGSTADDIVRFALERHIETKLIEITQLINYDTFKEVCGKQQLCIVAFLPHIRDCGASCRKNYLETLKGVMEKHKKMFWGWIWSEARAQPELEDSLGITDIGYPSLKVINIDKMRYSTMLGSFSFEDIDSFLRQLGFRPSPGGKMEMDINIFNVTAWNGKNYQSNTTSSRMSDDKDDDHDDEDDIDINLKPLLTGDNMEIEDVTHEIIENEIEYQRSMEQLNLNEKAEKDRKEQKARERKAKKEEDMKRKLEL